MNFTIKKDIQETKIVQSVFDKNNGNDETYKKYISDTEEAKNLIMTDFLQSEFKTYDDVTKWFVENYKMYDTNLRNETDKGHTYYRAFLSLENDVVFVLRVTNHYATRDSIKRIYKNTGVPKLELIYHIIIDRIEITYSSPKKIVVDGEKVKKVQNIENFVMNRALLMAPVANAVSIRGFRRPSGLRAKKNKQITLACCNFTWMPSGLTNENPLGFARPFPLLFP